jgi:hypothetical protein
LEFIFLGVIVDRVAPELAWLELFGVIPFDFFVRIVEPERFSSDVEVSTPPRAIRGLKASVCVKHEALNMNHTLHSPVRLIHTYPARAPYETAPEITKRSMNTPPETVIKR